MPLDARIKSWLAKAAPPQIDWKAGVAEARNQFWRTMQRLEADAPTLHGVRNLTVPRTEAGPENTLKARLYEPFAAGAARGAGLIYFHGGGFVLGDLESHDMLCRRLAAAAMIRVLSVEYRLAPEHKFPAAVEDAAAAVRWAFANAPELAFDPARIAIGGDSAGGNLAAVTAQAFKKAGAPRLKAQLLFYPCTQLMLMTPSQMRLRESYFLTQAAQDFFKDKYLRSREDAFDVRCSPLLENDLAGLPPTYLVTAGFDPLYDEGKAYGEKLAACGVPVAHEHYPRQVHGFFNMTAISPAAREAIEAAGAWLSARL